MPRARALLGLGLMAPSVPGPPSSAGVQQRGSPHLGPRRVSGCLADLTRRGSAEARFLSEGRDVVSKGEAEAQAQAEAGALAPVTKDGLRDLLFLPARPPCFFSCFILDYVSGLPERVSLPRPCPPPHLPFPKPRIYSLGWEVSQKGAQWLQRTRLSVGAAGREQGRPSPCCGHEGLHRESGRGAWVCHELAAGLGQVLPGPGLQCPHL